MAKDTVLVVDDEEHIIELSSMYLKQEGFAVKGARDGAEALDKIRTLKPALIVLDLMLPEVDGWEVCRRTRSESDVPIIMLTARSVAGEIRKARVKPGTVARISVADTGTGIPPEGLSRIFERFYRGDKSRTKQGKGAGLGLAIAKEIIWAHGGQIEAESVIGLGTKFTITLPQSVVVSSCGDSRISYPDKNWSNQSASAGKGDNR